MCCYALLMKILFFISLLCLSGCSSMGKLMQGAGDGLASASKTRELDCQKEYSIGTEAHYVCR
jgi:hypothetical protein